MAKVIVSGDGKAAAACAMRPLTPFPREMAGARPLPFNNNQAGFFAQPGGVILRPPETGLPEMTAVPVRP